jgi:hypothetical protein
MLRTKRSSKLPNGVLPANFSPATGTKFFDGITSHPPVRGLTEKYLLDIDISKGTQVGLLGGLRWLGIVDRESIFLNDSDLPAKLRVPQTRKQFFLDILNSKYEELMSFSDLHTYNADSLTSYFESKHIKDGTSQRVANCFIFLATQAGVSLAAQLPPISLLPNLSKRDNPRQVPAPFQPHKLSDNDKAASEIALLVTLRKNVESGATISDKMFERFDELWAKYGHLLPPNGQ